MGRKQLEIVTERDQDVKDYIISYAIEHGYLPTTEEIGRGCYMCTKSAWFHMRQLERKGEIIRKGTRWTVKGLKYVRG